MYSVTKGLQRPSNTEVIKLLGGYKLPWKYFLKAIYLFFRSTQTLSKPSGVTAHTAQQRGGPHCPCVSTVSLSGRLAFEWSVLLSSRFHFLKSDGKVTRVGVGSLDWSGSWYWPLFSLWPPGVIYSRSESLSPCGLTGVWGGWTNTCKMLCPVRKLRTSRRVVGLVACSCLICWLGILSYPRTSQGRTAGHWASFLGELVQLLEADAHFFLNACMFGLFCYCRSRVNWKSIRVGVFIHCCTRSS